MNDKLVLKRLVSIADYGITLGKLYEGGDCLAAVLELSWEDNKPFRSRIPAGIYDCVPHQSPSKGRVFKVLGTEPRTEILWHSGNVRADTKGCFLPGTHFGRLHDEPAVKSSQNSDGASVDEVRGEGVRVGDRRPRSRRDLGSMSKLARHLSELQLVPRIISLTLAFTAVVLTIRIVDSILPVDSVAELSALSGLIVAFLTTSSALVSMLARADSKSNGHKD